MRDSVNGLAATMLHEENSSFFSPVHPGINAASHVQAPIIFCCCCWYHIVIPLKFKDIRDFITHIFDSTEQKNSVWPRKRETLFSIVRSKFIEYSEKREGLHIFSISHMLSKSKSRQHMQEINNKEIPSRERNRSIFFFAISLRPTLHS